MSGASEKKRISLGRALVVAMVLGLLLFGIGYLLGGSGSTPSGGKATSVGEHAGHESAAEKPGDGQGDVVWTCSMHPQVRLPEPGQCPICFMDLIPVKKGGEDGEKPVSLRQIKLSEQARKLAQVQTAPVVRRAVEVDTHLAGKVDYDETRIGTITAWMGGRIDKLYVDYTGDEVRRGQPMALIYSPELLTAQSELIQAKKALATLGGAKSERVREAASRTLQAAREKLRLLGFSENWISQVEGRGVPVDHVTLTAPMGGVVIEKRVVEGMYVQTGMPIFRVADLSHVWVVLEAYESDLPWIGLGRQVAFTTEAHPGELFQGKVVYIDPMVDEKTRTVRVRLDALNPGGRLKPGMFVKAMQRTEKGAKAEAPLVIPASAPLLTGKRAVVYVAVPGREGVYEGREVVLGPKAGDMYIVREGLSEGEVVVVKGSFKIDSAVQIQAGPSMMSPSGGAGGMAGHAHHAPAGEAAASPEAMGGMGGASGMAAMTVPEAFGRQLPPLKAAFEELSSDVAAKDFAASLKAYKSFYDTLCAVDPRTITDTDAAMLWKELSMLLKNDSFLGSHAEDMAEATRLFDTMRDHFDRLAGNFSLEAVGGPLPGVPADFKKALGGVLPSYYEVQEALAADDLKTAKAAAGVLDQALGAVPAQDLDGAARKAWDAAAEGMRGGLKTLRGAEDLETARAGFEPLSVGLAAAVDKLGALDTGPVHELSCPMAGGGEGATWLSPGTEIRNPYFGSSMLTCGEVKRTLGLEAPAAPVGK